MTGSLRSKRGKFYALLNLRDEKGDRIQKPIDLHIDDVPGNKRKAKTALNKLLLEYSQNCVPVLKEEMKFCDYILEWLEEKKTQIDEDTYEFYLRTINKHIYPYFMKLDVSLQSLTHEHIQAYYDSKLNPADNEVKPLSVNSVKKHHTVINQTLKRAKRRNLIGNNPASDSILPKNKKFVGGFLSTEQGKILLNATKGKPVEAVVILAMVYGLRRSEIAGLKWDAVDYENDTITIRHVVTTIAKDKTKNKSSHRVLPLNAEVKSYLQNLFEKQKAEKTLLGSAYYETDYICRWADGTPLKVNYMSKAVKTLLVENDLPPIRLHDLRHSCASYMLKMGCNLKEVSDWLGHADIATTMNVYAHLDMESKRETANRFSAFLDLQTA